MTRRSTHLPASSTTTSTGQARDSVEEPTAKAELQVSLQKGEVYVSVPGSRTEVLLRVGGIVAVLAVPAVVFGFCDGPLSTPVEVFTMMLMFSSVYLLARGTSSSSRR